MSCQPEELDDISPCFIAVSVGESLMLRLSVCHEGYLRTDWELFVDQLLLMPHPKHLGKCPEIS